MRSLKFLLLGLALLVLPATTLPAQEVATECTTPEYVMAQGAANGYVNRLEITGKSVSAFMDAYARAFNVSRTELIPVDVVELYSNPAEPNLMVLIAYDKGCVVGSQVLPADLAEAIYKAYQDQRAKDEENGQAS